MIAPDFEVPAGRLVVLGDTRPPDYLEFFLENSRRVPRLVFEAVARERPVALVHCGDIAVYGAAARFWQGWTGFDRDIRSISEAGIPIYPAVGNHEYRGFARESLRLYFERFPHLGGKRWYTLRCGGLLFVFLDSNFGKLGAERVREQDHWLRETLAAAAADPATRLILPVVHHPPFTNISPRYLVFESSEVQRRWVPLFAAHSKVAAVFSGHVHAFEHFLIEGVHYIVTGGAGSPRFHLRSDVKRRRADLFAHPNGKLRPFHYLRLEESKGAAAPAAAIEVVVLERERWSIGDRFAVTSKAAARSS
jgi:hypothetical protein